MDFIVISMKTGLLCFTLLAATLGMAPTSAAEPSIGPALGCRSNPARSGACFAAQGRLALYNGTPAIRIRLKGSKRLLGVLPAEDEIMPAALKEALDFEHDLSADLILCPLTPARTGQMQGVCIESATAIRSLPHTAQP